jgi:D-alanine transaminase
MPTVYLNGTFMPMEEACIPVTDRGFLFGDGVYEVIPAYGGRLFRLSHHLQRLQNSLDGIRLASPLDNSEWENVLNALLAHNAEKAGRNNDQAVYLQITRGSAAKRDHSFPADIRPTVYAASNPIPDPDPQIARQGLAAVTLDDIRWKRCDIKATTLLANVLLRQQAVDQQAAEAILVHDGLATEGSASNLFVVKDGIILTPPKNECLLPGITRDLVLELAEKHALPCKETDIPLEQLLHADEIWITSSTREIVPITRLNNQPVGEGKPGEVWKTISRHYRGYKNAVRNALAD